MKFSGLLMTFITPTDSWFYVLYTNFHFLNSQDIEKWHEFSYPFKKFGSLTTRSHPTLQFLGAKTHIIQNLVFVNLLTKKNFVYINIIIFVLGTLETVTLILICTIKRFNWRDGNNIIGLKCTLARVTLTHCCIYLYNSKAASFVKRGKVYVSVVGDYDCRGEYG